MQGIYETRVMAGLGPAIHAFIRPGQSRECPA